eukprot:snap_masked-scaffold_1-processed-gene-31.5-mRNA-1 protein AED:1.00 eAED:1.00 QI:0/0/0/0/1/1/2/0/59
MHKLPQHSKLLLMPTYSKYFSTGLMDIVFNMSDFDQSKNPKRYSGPAFIGITVIKSRLI